MRIGIDARLIGETGVGRYIRNLIGELAKQDTTHEYVIFLTSKNFDAFILPHTHWNKVRADIHWHTLQEQIQMPKIFREATLDLLHIPYHNPPILYGGRMVVTIHDLTILHFATGKATTLPCPLYYLKRLGYWLVLSIGLLRAQKIIAVSETTKREIVDHFHIPEKKIMVTYEGVSLPKVETKRIIKEPYVLYVGNAYPHKNLETLLKAMKHVQAKIVLVGNDDFFYRRLKKIVGDDTQIVFFGSANDMQLVSLYQNAMALVFPSLMEGFGLPALEALSIGCPVAVSDIAVFHEILGDTAAYFDPNDPISIARTLNTIEKKDILRNFFNKYSWRRMADKTRKIYEGSIGI